MKLITSESAELAAKLNNSDASKQRSKVKQFRRKNISQKGEVKRPRSKQNKTKGNESDLPGVEKSQRDDQLREVLL